MLSRMHYLVRNRIDTAAKIYFEWRPLCDGQVEWHAFFFKKSS